jgi:hypothetical protein
LAGLLSVTVVLVLGSRAVTVPTLVCWPARAVAVAV